MTMAITHTAISSRDTRRAAFQAGDGSWTVTWLPGRALSQAITAMLIAWTAELGLTGREAIGLAASPPDVAAPQGEGIRPWAVPRPR
jgi:hypothetical protein